MNDDYGADGALDEAAARPLDTTDEALLREVAQLLVDVDPVPEDLVQRIQFSLALDEMYAEVAAITRMPLDAMAVRGEATGTRTETLTFSAQRLSAMVTVSRVGERCPHRRLGGARRRDRRTAADAGRPAGDRGRRVGPVRVRPGCRRVSRS